MGDTQEKNDDPGGLKRLVAEMAGGDENALAALYDATHRTVYGLAYRLMKDAALAEDVVHDVFMQAWRTAAKYSSARGTPKAWLMIMTRSRSLDRLRSITSTRRRETSLDTAADAETEDASPPDLSIDVERRQHVHRVLGELPEPQRHAIELAYFTGLTHTEIALQLGVPLGTVKTRIRLAMRKLHEQLMPVLEAS